jgi:hypothetical protein
LYFLKSTHHFKGVTYKKIIPTILTMIPDNYLYCVCNFVGFYSAVSYI